MAKIIRSEPRDGSPLPHKPTADAKVTANECQRASPLTPTHEALVELLAQALVDDYLSEAGRSAEARLITKDRKGVSHGQDHPT